MMHWFSHQHRTGSWLCLVENGYQRSCADAADEERAITNAAAKCWSFMFSTTHLLYFSISSSPRCYRTAAAACELEAL